MSEKPALIHQKNSLVIFRYLKLPCKVSFIKLKELLVKQEALLIKLKYLVLKT